MMRRARYVLAVVVFAGAVGACGSQSGSTEEATVTRSEAELRAIEADQRIRDATLVVRAMQPEERDLSPLLDLLGTEGLRSAAIEFCTSLSSWPHAYEVDGQIDVVRQETRELSDDEVVVVTTCERDWINMIDVNGEVTVFRGGRAAAGAVSRTFGCRRMVRGRRRWSGRSSPTAVSTQPLRSTITVLMPRPGRQRMWRRWTAW